LLLLVGAAHEGCGLPVAVTHKKTTVAGAVCRPHCGKWWNYL